MESRPILTQIVSRADRFENIVCQRLLTTYLYSTVGARAKERLVKLVAFLGLA